MIKRIFRLVTILIWVIPALLYSADAPTVEITVLDARTEQPIPAFRVIAGTPGSIHMGQEFRARTGTKEIVNWQPHMTRVGKNGHHSWSLKRAYKKMALRVEADGYIPDNLLYIVKEEGGKELTFKLKPDPGVAGQVLMPDGQPAAGAQIGLAMAHRDVVIENGKIKHADEPLPEKPGDRWRRPAVVTADDEGHFLLPTESDPVSAVIVVHEQGMQEMRYADFVKKHRITLKPWGHVKGTVTIGTKPGLDEKVTLSIHRDEYGYPGMLACYMEMQSDTNGGFAFDKIPPGHAQISLPDYFPEVRNVSFHIPIPPDAFRHVEILPGKLTEVAIGGKNLKRSGVIKIEVQPAD